MLERRPVGLRNREGSRNHNEVRVAIGALYGPAIDEDSDAGEEARLRASAEIAGLGNAENESLGIELGYHYAGSPIVAAELGAEVPRDPLRYEPNTLPGARLPSLFLADGSAADDRLDSWFTVIAFGSVDVDVLVAAARQRQVPLSVLRLDDDHARKVYAADILIIRPDQHVAWRGQRISDTRAANAIISMMLGWESGIAHIRPRPADKGLDEPGISMS